MKLESPLQVARRKLTYYLLVFRDKDDKSNYLGLAGYALENWPALEQNLMKLAPSDVAINEGEDVYGPSFSITGELKGPNGHLLRYVSRRFGNVMLTKKPLNLLRCSLPNSRQQ